MEKINYYYDERMIADAKSFSLSPLKPKKLHDRVVKLDLPMRQNPITPVTRDDLLLSHRNTYVDGIMNLEIANGFGNKSQAVADSLYYTVGAEYCAAVDALQNKIAWAFCSGFHHAHPHSSHGFCTFEGLSITGKMLRRDKLAERILIVDGDAHFGDGTSACIKGDKNFEYVSYAGRVRAVRAMEDLSERITKFNPDIILFQDGMDAYRYDALGNSGLHYTELFQRTEAVCVVAKNLSVPIVINLAGGYLRLTEDELSENPGMDIIEPVLRGHTNSLVASIAVFMPDYANRVVGHCTTHGFWEKRRLAEEKKDLKDVSRKLEPVKKDFEFDMPEVDFGALEEEMENKDLIQHLRETAKQEIIEILSDNQFDEETKAELIIDIVANSL